MNEHSFPSITGLANGVEIAGDLHASQVDAYVYLLYKVCVVDCEHV